MRKMKKYSNDLIKYNLRMVSYGGVAYVAVRENDKLNEPTGYWNGIPIYEVIFNPDFASILIGDKRKKIYMRDTKGMYFMWDKLTKVYLTEVYFKDKSINRYLERVKIIRKEDLYK